MTNTIALGIKESVGGDWSGRWATPESGSLHPQSSLQSEVKCQVTCCVQVPVNIYCIKQDHDHLSFPNLASLRWSLHLRHVRSWNSWKLTWLSSQVGTIMRKIMLHEFLKVDGKKFCCFLCSSFSLTYKKLLWMCCLNSLRERHLPFGVHVDPTFWHDAHEHTNAGRTTSQLGTREHLRRNLAAS